MVLTDALSVFLDEIRKVPLGGSERTQGGDDRASFLSFGMECHASLTAQKRDMFQLFERHAFCRILDLTIRMRCNVRPKYERALFVANC